MSIPSSFIQVFFSLVCVLFSVNFATHYFDGGWSGLNITVGFAGGAILAAVLTGANALLNRVRLRAFNTAILGLFLGYLMAQAILMSLGGIIGWNLQTEEAMLVRFLIFLFSLYAGLMITRESAEEFSISLPFVEFQRISHKKKDILCDLSIFSDPRVIDLATSGLLDHQLVIPRFAIKELYAQLESGDELVKSKAKRALEVIKKLESLPSLEIRYVEMDFPEIKDPMAKLIRLARTTDTHIITSDINRIQQSCIEGVRIINIHMLSNALKPITQTGESIHIKIQRYGKEARQGVGYLEDGTMVVVNGGAEFIGETIKGYVLSVKHTSSGRMIFCNAADDLGLSQEDHSVLHAHELESHKNFLTL